MFDGAQLDAVRGAERLIRTAAWILDRLDDLERGDARTTAEARALIGKISDERLDAMLASGTLVWFDLANELIERGGALISIDRTFSLAPRPPASREPDDAERKRGQNGGSLIES